jgi:hypothetical protein
MLFSGEGKRLHSIAAAGAQAAVPVRSDDDVLAPGADVGDRSMTVIRPFSTPS